MTDHLLLVSIGPIQDFIASARKAQDLWFGSWLLSDLARAAAAELTTQGAELIFPGSLGSTSVSQTQDDDVSVANKILARLPDKVGGDVEKIVDAAHGAMKTRLSRLAKALLDNARKRADELGKHLEEDRARAQIDDLMEFIWVAVPLGAGDTAYRQARDRCEALLAARKNTKDWGSAAQWAQPGVPKSSLDGLRESVLDEYIYAAIKDKPGLAERARRAFGIRPAERLCGVGLLKRLGQEAEVTDNDDLRTLLAGRPSFHSTSHSAALTLRRHLSPGGKGLAAWQNYLGHLGREDVLGKEAVARLKLTARRSEQPVYAFDGYDGSLLYPERLLDAMRERHGVQKSRNELLSVDTRKEAEELRLAVLRACGVSEAPAYDALLLADGDRMGKAIDACANQTRHQALSQALDAFARSVRGIVGSAEHAGSLIYAGGDDVLALLPLDTALACADALRQRFAEALTEFKFKDKDKDKDKHDRAPTLSVGVAVAHHLTPFALVREQAKRAEKAAKETRNALAISVDKRSGGEVLVSGSWDDGTPTFFARLQQWKQFYAGKEIPHGLLHDIEAIIGLAEPGRHPRANAAGEDEQLGRMLRHELTRVLVRKEPDSGKRDHLSKNVNAALHAAGNDAKNKTTAASLRQLADELYVALELVRADRAGAADNDRKEAA